MQRINATFAGMPRGESYNCADIGAYEHQPFIPVMYILDKCQLMNEYSVGISKI